MPSRPNFFFTRTIIVFFLVKAFFFGKCSSWILSSFLFLMRATTFSLISTKKVTPVKPPRLVTVTDSKNENPAANAAGTAPKTNFTVLSKKIPAISHHDPKTKDFRFYARTQGHLRHQGPELYTIERSILRQRHRTRTSHFQEDASLHNQGLHCL